jgi:hypothetical protein
VFSTEGASVVTEASDRRDARSVSEPEPAGAGARGGRGGRRKGSILDLPDAGPPSRDGEELVN